MAERMKSDLNGDPSKLVRTPRPAEHDSPHPLYVVWELTLRCDLGCKHCGSRAGRARSDELTTEECLDVVRQIAEMGAREVTLIGGEAYLREDWTLVAAEITRLGMACSITTGALHLTQERVDAAAKAGVLSIAISIDGLESTHDAQRGVKGSWRAAVEASRRVARSSMRVTTNTQINMLSLPELPAIADLMVEVGSAAWQIQLTVAMGRAADRPDLLLQPCHLLELFPLLAWIKETKLDPNGIALVQGNNVGYFGPYEEVLRYGGELGAHWQPCSAGKWTLGLEADGKIKGCPSLPTEAYTGGNIRDRRILEVIHEAPELRGLRERTRDDLWGYCHDCYYADACLGGCSWTAHSLFGRPGNNPYCIHRALEFERKGLRERVTRVRHALGKPFDHGHFEIVVEPMPEESEGASVAGVDVQTVVALRPSSAGAWSQEDLRRRLRR